MAVKLIHKNSGVKNKPASPSQLDYGEIAINWHESGPFLQVKDSQNEIIRVGGVIIQDNQPVLAQKGAFWVSGNELYLYNGTAWILIAGGGGGSDFTACTNGGLEYDGAQDCWKIDEAWLLQWANDNRPDMVEPGDGTLTLKDSNGDTLGVFTANQTGDTEIIIPAGPTDWNDIINKPDIGDGPLTIKDANGTTLGTFTANQQGSTEINLPAGFSGDYDDLANKPTIGDGNIVINGGDGITASGDNATANQAGDTARTLSVDTTWLGTWIDTNKPAPNVGDGQITLKDADGNPVGQFTVNQASDQDIILPAIPDSLHPKGFINVDDPAPANPEVGDIYIQHKDDVSDGISDASFAPGIPTGTAVEEGTFVMYGADLQWHAGSKSTSTQVQSNWNETNTTEPSFIQNKPDIDGMIDAKVNDGKLTLTNKHNTAKVLEFTANQSANDTVQMPYMPLDIRELQELS